MNKYQSFLFPLVIICVICLALFAQFTLADSSINTNTLYVAPSGDCGGATPCYANPQEAVNAAFGGDEIKIAGGTYTGVNDLGGLAQVVYITKSVNLRGGYSITDWNFSDPVSNPTEINALVQGRVVYIDGEGIYVTLENLNLSYGNANGLGGSSSGLDAGGGLYGLLATININNCSITDSTVPASGYGGGIYVRDSEIKFTNSVVEGNYAGYAGGVYLSSSAGVFENNQVLLNSITNGMGYGTGMWVSMSDIVIKNNIFRENTSTYEASWAAALNVSSGTVEILDNLIENNTRQLGLSGSSAGTTPAYLTVRGNTIRDNSGGVSFSKSVYLTMINNLVESNNSQGLDISLEAYPASVYVAGNIIRQNISYVFGDCGAGLHANDGLGWPIKIIGNLIQNNINGADSVSGGNGGGVCLLGDSIELRNNIIQGNHAKYLLERGRGGGVYINGDSALSNNIITNNSADLEGAGIAIIGSSPTLFHNTVANNSGTGICILENSDDHPAQPELYNTIIANQTTGINVSSEVLNTALVDGVLWWNNTANTGGGGTFFLFHEYTGDPSFVDVPGGDFHISSESTAIDHGIITDILIDIDGEPRFKISDIGADEYWAPGALKRLFLPLLLK